MVATSRSGTWKMDLSCSPKRRPYGQHRGDRDACAKVLEEVGLRDWQRLAEVRPDVIVHTAVPSLVFLRRLFERP